MRDPRAGGRQFHRELLALSRPELLVLRALGLGDALTAVPALRALRSGHPTARITLAAPSWLEPLQSLGLEVDRWWPVSGLGHRCWPQPAPELAVNLHGRGPQSTADLLSTGAAEVLTHRHAEHPGVPGPPWLEEQHEVVRWCRLLEYGGLSADPADLLLPAPPLDPVLPAAVVVHPGASAPSRRWPAEWFAEIVRHLADRGERIAVTGGAAERDLADRVVEIAGVPAARSVAGDLSLPELAALVAAARLVICGDTGVAHLASAYRTPSVLIFGPTSPERWGPPAAGPHTVLWAGRRGNPHADEPDPGLLEVSVTDVVDVVEQTLADSRG